ncbi:hypothetical protein [Nocardia sp. NPDC005998]|uniref:hypothetical protein n=1 Tax=Nocardia sp. NPDC005998 TaxID=3156894 RepID=UPI0033AA9446
MTVATARLPRKPIVLGLVAVAVVANLGSALAPNYSILLLARFVAGLVVATSFAVAIATVTSSVRTVSGLLLAPHLLRHDREPVQKSS